MQLCCKTHDAQQHCVYLAVVAVWPCRWQNIVTRHPAQGSFLVFWQLPKILPRHGVFRVYLYKRSRRQASIQKLWAVIVAFSSVVAESTLADRCIGPICPPSTSVRLTSPLRIWRLMPWWRWGCL